MKGSNYGTDSHSLGRDPIGSKGFKPAIDISVKEAKSIAAKLGLVVDNDLKKGTGKKLILESIQVAKKKDSDKGTYLDESNISE